MRPLHIRTIAVAAAVSATALVAAVSATPFAAGGPAAADAPGVDVEQLAQQYRSRYQLKLDEARGLVAEVPATERRSDI
jgi:hypothetical protein